ncbi:helicase-related protein [Nibrella saemangeumensis]|uniref:Helicase-related protein n=1 Tax=Nibrella saemangeumensis TaxID=1084526 RepID=A0ABP8N8B8_9BACT
MLPLEQIQKGILINGLLPNQAVQVIHIEWSGEDALEITYKNSQGQLGNQLLFRDSESSLSLVDAERSWNFGADAKLFKLASEAYRIKLAYLFDPMMAVHTSMVEPLPHQISAVYGEMLPRQPLRFLLADDPGAGKTIMAGLLIKELYMRGDVRKCLIVCPGVLAEQWQDELNQKFQLPFDILTNDKINASRTGNYFLESPMVIARLDKLSRDEDLREKLKVTDWDLVIVDEAHKMSASYFGNEVNYTQRYRLGQLLSSLTRHLLLMTATPHNGKEEDFQLFLALLDPDRFEGRQKRSNAPITDVSDLMRRMLKEQLVKFDGRPLFPERIAKTVLYELSDDEDVLYSEVTRYVQDEFNRADALDNTRRRGSVGFALTILQRRLASSPDAIYQSLRRRRERLSERLTDERRFATLSDNSQWLDDEQLEQLDDQPSDEQEELENNLTDNATAARTIRELEIELDTLRRLESLADQVRTNNTDRKWAELSTLLQDRSVMFDEQGVRRKLVIFTEHRDTLNYLAHKIRMLLGSTEGVVTIQGGMNRDARRQTQEAFRQDINVCVLIATDAAGEGINLQRAHLMVNYDLPWNPNRLEQRFGRIHRIGQTEVCRLWNLVADSTIEGDVWQRLFAKLEAERQSLGGRVFDVLGEVTFDNKSLRELMMEAIRYGHDPAVRERLNQVVEDAVDRQQIERLLQERALHNVPLSHSNLQQIREDMERAEARRLQPHFIADFFLTAFRQLGGTIHERENGRYQIAYVPSAIRNRGRTIDAREPVLQSYERITFHKEWVNLPSRPVAAFVCPGHPLLDATLDLLLEANQNLLKQGAVLIDDNAPYGEPRVLVYVENAIQDAHLTDSTQRRTVSREVHFLEFNANRQIRRAGYAPYLDYRPAADAERDYLMQQLIGADWLQTDFESVVRNYAISTLAKEHLDRVREQRQFLIQRTRHAVQQRLTAEVRYWDRRSRELAAQEQEGKPNARLNSNQTRKRADDLATRLSRRMDELDLEMNLSLRPPLVIGGALVVPSQMLQGLNLPVSNANSPEADENTGSVTVVDAAARAAVERAAMQAVMHYERSLGNEPTDRSADKIGYDIESRDGQTGHLRFIEVKGRRFDADTITLTKNEILTALNQPERFYLAVALVNGQNVTLHYVQRPFQTEPDFNVTSVTYQLAGLLTRPVASVTITLDS